MKWERTLLNAIVGSSLGLLFCCGGSKQLVRSENTDVHEEVNYIPYYLKVYEADSLYLTGNYERSFQILDSLFREFEPLNYEYNELETYIKASYLTSNNENTKKYFEILISTYGLRKEFIKEDRLMYLAFNSLNFDSKTIDELEKLYLSNVNYELRDLISEMVYKDQLHRQKGTVNKDSMRKIDKENELKLIEIFNNYGYPNEKIGCKVKVKNRQHNQETNISILLMHTDDSIRIHYFLPKILDFVKKGDVTPSIFAKLTDQLYLYNDQKQIFGTYSNSPLQYGKRTTDSLRKSIGLTSYKEYDKWRAEKKYGVKLP